MIASTVERGPRHTSIHVNEEIGRRTEESVLQCATAVAGAIARRLAELDREWDIERVIEAHAAGISLAGLALGAAVNRKWFIVPAAIAGFLLLHAVQGMYPPMIVLRRLGFRTASEIDEERFALKALRGDFDGLSTRPDRQSVAEAVEAVRR